MSAHRFAKLELQNELRLVTMQKILNQNIITFFDFQIIF
jgi:hypothetical protein